MSRILITLLPSNDLGLITRALPVAQALRNVGHTVYFTVCSKVPSKLVKKENFQNIPIRTPLDNLFFKIKTEGGIKELLKKKKYKKLFKIFFQNITMLIKSLPIGFVKPTAEVFNMEHFFVINGMHNRNYILYKSESYMKVIKKSNAEFVIDFWNPYAVIAAKTLNIPLITINQFDVHPYANGFMWWKKTPPKFIKVVQKVNSVLQYYNLNIISKLEDLTIGDLTLTLGMPAKNEDENSLKLKHIGFLVYQKENAKLPKEIENLGDAKPIVWLYSGNPRYAGIKTDFDSEILLDICIGTLSKENINIVLTTGFHSIPKKYLPLPHNIFYFDFVDGLLMAKKSDIMIHHGGYGSCQTALLTGTPSLIVPTFSERESNARRIAKLGTGEFVLPVKRKFLKTKTVDKAEFVAKFRKILNDESYKKNAVEISKQLKEFNKRNNSITYIQNFIEKYNSETKHLKSNKIIFDKKYSRNLTLISNSLYF